MPRSRESEVVGWGERAYGAALRAARALSPVLGTLRPSLSPAIEERRGAAAALEAWASRGAPQARQAGPLLWLHGASAGELLGAAPALTALRRRLPLQLVVTHFSPSGAAAAASLDPDWSGYPPFDAPEDCRRAVRAVAPSALVFASGDLWPGLSRAAAEARVPTGMVNAVVRSGSSRLRGPVRRLVAPAYRRLERVGAVSEEDAERLRRLGVRSEALRITGDAAFDRALERAERSRRSLREARIPTRRSGAPVLVAGSTWPEDEEALLRAAAGLARRGTASRLVLVPHQPGARAVEALRQRCTDSLGAEPILWSESGQGADGGGSAASSDSSDGSAPVVRLLGLLGDADRSGRPLVVDAVGFLADLYVAADVAWVGGGFGRAGLHSVVEPAAAGAPVLFGPRHDRREARELIARNAARSVDDRTLPEALAALFADPTARRAAGDRARAYVEEGAGAAEATAELMLELVDSSSRR